MKDITKINRSTMEYAFVLILTLMSAADKLFYHPTKTWWDVTSIIAFYYLVLFLGAMLESFLDWVIGLIEKKNNKNR